MNGEEQGNINVYDVDPGPRSWNVDTVNNYIKTQNVKQLRRLLMVMLIDGNVMTIKDAIAKYNLLYEV